MKARLLILGTLHRGDMHPYEIKRRLDAAMVECYLDVDVGSLYYAIGQLEKDGSIAPVAQERVPRGGVRTIYTITRQGRAEFEEGFYQLFADDRAVSQTLYGPLLFLHCIPPDKLAEAIRRKIARTEELIAELESLWKEMATTVSTGGDLLFRHLEKQRRLDREWLKELLAEVESAPRRRSKPGVAR
jgi:DNA-binding PadR family transcriptional regulator